MVVTNVEELIEALNQFKRGHGENDGLMINGCRHSLHVERLRYEAAPGVELSAINLELRPLGAKSNGDFRDEA